MSYILDALRKADHERERERGGVPDLHTQTAPPVAAEPATSGATQPLLWAVVALSLLLLGLLAWLWARRETPPAPAPVVASAGAPLLPVPSAATSVVTSTEPPVAPRQPLTSPAPPTPTPLLPPPGELQPAPPAALAAAAPVPAPLASPAPPAPPAPLAPLAPISRSARPAPQPTAVAVAPAIVPAAPAAVTVAPPAPPRLAAQGGDAVPTLDELPAEVRRQLPALAINGSKYSTVPEQRILIVNGQVFREGDHPVPELTIEQIRLKAVLLRFRGYRYLMSF